VRLSLPLLLAFGALAVAVPSGPALAADTPSPEQQLADRYAPIVALKKQDKACDSDGEPYRPVPADVVLGRADVKLVDSHGKLLKAAPTAADLFGRRGYDVYLDFPRSPLNPGCSYEKWARSISAGKPTTAYAHVVAERGKPGKLALQYWLYYPFNDWNNKHESDWEMIQLMFDASSASQALERRPTEVGFSQHDGAERANWDDGKLARRGTHTVVYPGRGSHANYFESRVWLGHSAQEGFGCDDTRGPSSMLQTHAVLLPDRPASATAPFAWLAYNGHWGQQESGPNTGPDGPNVKTQWTKPVSWSDDTWRASSTAVPLESTFGPSTTDFFCGAVEAGSKIYLRFLRTPWSVLAFFGLLALLVAWLTRRTRWSPLLDEPLDQARTGGQIYRTARLIYSRHLRMFLGIGLAFIPLGIAGALIQKAFFDLTGVGTFVAEARSDSIVTGIVALVFGQLSTIAGSILVTAVVALALSHADEGERPNALRAYRAVLPHLGSLAWAWARVIVVSLLLTITVIGIPVAVVYLVRKAVLTQACVLEHLSATHALRRSSRLVGRSVPRVLAITSLVNVSAYLAGPIVGLLFLFLTKSSLAFVNTISSLVYVVVMPYAGVAIALLFFDLRCREAGEEPVLSPSAPTAPAAPAAPVAPTASH
jgi:hypothetical protein